MSEKDFAAMLEKHADGDVARSLLDLDYDPKKREVGIVIWSTLCKLTLENVK